MIDYKKAGVDIDRGNRFVRAVARCASGTKRPEVLGNIGGFSAFTKIPKGYKDPVLVSSTDGVGTKLTVAEAQGRHDTIGIDLVAMCANDIVVAGASPLFFLDYLATGRLNSKKALEVVKGIARGCREAGCALIGGETAEMPGMYKTGQYDLAGFCVGVVERDRIIDGRTIKPGDRVIGIGSSGLHSNGFSLARKVFTKRELGGEAGRVLLKPTIIYAPLMLRLMNYINIKSAAHITGGGLYDNIARVLSKKTSALIHKGLWRIPRIFKVIQQRAGIDDREMYRTFNMGIGMVLVVPDKDLKRAHYKIKKFGLRPRTIGEIIRGDRGVII